MNLHHFRCFVEHVRMLLENQRALCKAPGGAGSICEYLEAVVRSTRVSSRLAYGFRTELHFADAPAQPHPENERQQSVNRASTERQQSVNRVSTERQQSVNRASTERQQSVNRASTERQQSINRASTKRQLSVNKASTERQQSVNRASTECQQSVNRVGTER